MKRRLFIVLLLVLLPLVASAQVAGGQVRRPVKKTKTETAKPAKPAKKQNTSSASVAKPTARKPAQQPQKSPGEAIIQRLIANMVYVEGGTFTMGATSEQGSDAYDYEKPAHQVTVSSFSIGKYEVTQEEWQAVMGSNPSNFKGSKLPVECVSWNDCQEFIRKLNSMTGKRFRLPTEAEWEYAARGGNRSGGYKYAGSNMIDHVAWYDGNSGSRIHDVGRMSPNELGLYDMAGNVWEWCYDWYDSYSSGLQNNPTGPSSGSCRVFRGGGWDFYAKYCRVSYRNDFTPVSRSGSLGLRLAL